MQLSNPIRPGSVTTDDLADGAVTLPKTNFAGSPLPVADGGTGTATPAIVGGAGIEVTGAFPNQTIVNTGKYQDLPIPLPVADGGTGTDAPGIVAGANIAVTGSFPTQTVEVTSNPSFAQVGITLTGDTSGLVISGNKTYGYSAEINLQAEETYANPFTLLQATVAGQGTNDSAVGDGVISSKLGPIRLSGNGATTGIELGTGNETAIATLNSLGGQPATGLGAPVVVATYDADVTSFPVDAISFTPTVSGMYRVSCVMTPVVAGSDAPSATLTWAGKYANQTLDALVDNTGSWGIYADRSGTYTFYAVTGTAIVVQIAETGTPTTHVAVVLERLS